MAILQLKVTEAGKQHGIWPVTSSPAYIQMSIDKCMDKENGIYLTLKEKEIMAFIIIWIDLEDIY